MNYYGCHITIQKGIINALKNLIELKGNIVQIFISNPLSTKYLNLDKKYDKNAIDDINYFVKINNLKIVIHLPYVINIATADINLNLIYSQLNFCSKIHGLGCVIHVGKSGKYLSEYEGEDNMYDNLKKIIKYMEDKKLNTYIILETAAGQGTELLCTENNLIDKLSNFYNRFNNHDKKYLRICIDTCHIYSAGFDIRQKKQVKDFYEQIEKKIGIKYIALIHLNDSRGEYNCHLDRHANLGEGTIGLVGLKEFIKYSLYYQIPIVLETHSNYKNEIKLIKKINLKLEKKLLN